MGKKKSQRTKKDSFDSEDDSSTMQPEIHKDLMLDQSLDALYEKSRSTREHALASIVKALTNDLQHEFLEKNFATLLQQCLNCIKKGSTKETTLASHVIGLLALTVGRQRERAQEILDKSFTLLSQTILNSCREDSKITSVLECLAVITFVGGINTEQSMDKIWQMIAPRHDSDDFLPDGVITKAVCSWTFLLTKLDRWTLGPNFWIEIVSSLSVLVEKDDPSLRIAAGEALAVIFDFGTPTSVTREGLEEYMRSLKAAITNQVEFLEGGYVPEITTKVGDDLLDTSTWCQVIRLGFLKRFLGEGFTKHMQDNEFLHYVFSFTPNKKFDSQGSSFVSSKENRFFKSPYSAQSKARSKFLKAERMYVKEMSVGHYAATMENV